MTETITAPWDQQPDEPDDLYARFTIYRNFGRMRTLRLVYNRARLPHATIETPASWYDAFAAWNWRERAALWDEDQQTTYQRATDDSRTQERTERLMVLKAARGKLLAAMQTTEATDPRYGEIIGNLATITEQMRKESSE